MKKNRKVIVIGGGIAGTSLALFLHKIGMQPEIYELRKSLEGIGGGLNIAPNGMNVLAELGLDKEIIQQGCIIDKAIFKNSRGCKLAKMQFTNLEKFPFPSLNVKRQSLLEVLAKAVISKGIPFYFGKKMSSIEQGINGVTVSFEDQTSVSGDLLIGADGVNSKVRKFVAPEVQPDFTGIVSHAGFISTGKLPLLKSEDIKNLNFVYGKNGFFGFAGVNDKEMMWWTNVLADQPWTTDQLRNINESEEKNTLNQQYSQYRYPISEIINNSDSYIRINVFDVRFLPKWYNNRIMLIGDAAHAVSPNSGQGASMALEDSILLAKLLRDQEDYNSVYDTFEKLRRPRVEKIVLEGRKRGEDKVVVGGFQQFIRETMIRIFINLFGTKGNDWLFSYKVKWNEE